MSELIYREAVVARLLGVAKSVLPRLRTSSLTEGDHWKKEGRAVKYTEAGMVALLGLLTSTSEDGRESVAGQEGLDVQAFCLRAAEQSARKPTRKKKSARLCELLVKRFYRNRRMIGADLDGVLQRVMVRDGSEFVKGTLIECVQVKGSLWRFCGRIPRSRRNWKRPDRVPCKKGEKRMYEETDHERRARIADEARKKEAAAAAEKKEADDAAAGEPTDPAGEPAGDGGETAPPDGEPTGAGGEPTDPAGEPAGDGGEPVGE